MEEFFKRNKINLDSYHQLFISYRSPFTEYWGLGFISILWNILCSIVVAFISPIFFIVYTIYAVFMCIINFFYYLIFKSYYEKKRERKEIEEHKKILLELQNSIELWVSNYQRRLNDSAGYILKKEIYEKESINNNKINNINSINLTDLYSIHNPTPMYLKSRGNFHHHSNLYSSSYKSTSTKYEIVKIEDKDLKTFISNFFKTYYKEYYTFNLNGILICNPWKRRSLHDLYLISKSYFPKCTFEEVIKIVINMTEHHTPVLNYSFCGDVRKYVFNTGEISSFRGGGRPLEFSNSLTFDNLKEYYKYEK